MGYAQDADQIMLINEVKKALYRQKPLARRFYMGEHVYKYECDLTIPVSTKPFRCVFTVPVDDMGETLFIDSIHAQLLIRYLDIL